MTVLQLDSAGRQSIVGAVGRSGRDDAGDPDDVLGPHVDGVVDDALSDAGVVAEVDEGQLLAVLTAGRHPAAQS